MKLKTKLKNLYRPDWTIGYERDPKKFWLDKNENSDNKLFEISKKILDTKYNMSGAWCLILYTLITLKTNSSLNYIGFGKHQLNAKGNQVYYWGERVLNKPLMDIHNDCVLYTSPSPRDS